MCGPLGRPDSEGAEGRIRDGPPGLAIYTHPAGPVPVLEHTRGRPHTSSPQLGSLVFGGTTHTLRALLLGKLGSWGGGEIRGQEVMLAEEL